ncbi:MAG: hypothetical protein EBU88_18450, partial [Acidobacteria bacterium]|nr:hypothetical protein [Acidobacteriota bacterium]
GVTSKSKVAFSDIGGTWLIGNGTGSGDTKVLIGAFGGTINGAVDRLVTLDGSGNVRLLEPTTVSDYATQVTSATTITTSNVAGAGAATRDDNARVNAALTLNIPASSNVLKGEYALNSWLQTAAATTTIGENNLLRLGGRTADTDYAATSGSGMMLFTAAATINGGTLDFNNREAIIRSNATSLIRSEITGAAGLTKSGTSDLSLSGFNSYSGVTTVTQGTLRLYNAASLGTTGTIGTNGTLVTNANLALNSGVNVGSFNLSAAATEELMLDLGANLIVEDQANVWNGRVLINSAYATGQPENMTIQVNDNAVLVINGALTGAGLASGGRNIDPAYNNNEGRGLIFTNGGSGASRNGVVRVNGAMSDEDGLAGGLANHERLKLFVRGYTGSTSATNNEFNVFLNDATLVNGVLDLRSGYL